VNVSAVLDTLLYGNRLKQAARTGWAQRGVPKAENVAAHTYGVVYTTLILAQVIDEPIDLGQALAMATLHDLAEALTSDIPAPAWRYLPPGIKPDVERQAMLEILGHAAFAPTLMALWEELHVNETAEARLVHDADKLELFLQALVYEGQTGNRYLAEFWQRPPAFHFAASEAIYHELRARGGKDVQAAGET
jgi:putative hydrolase of HD superfamily